MDPTYSAIDTRFSNAGTSQGSRDGLRTRQMPQLRNQRLEHEAHLGKNSWEGDQGPGPTGHENARCAPCAVPQGERTLGNQRLLSLGKGTRKPVPAAPLPHLGFSARVPAK